MSEIALIILVLAGVGLFVGGFFVGIKYAPKETEVIKVKVPHVVEVPVKTRESSGRVAYSPDELSQREAVNNQKVQQIMREAEY